MKFFILFLLTTVSINSFADIVGPLSATDPLAKITNAISTQLSDGNISTGTTSLWSGKLKTSGSFESVLKKGFADAFKDHTGESLPADATLKVLTHNFIDGEGKIGDVYKMTAALMESNDYTPTNSEFRESQARYLWAVLRKFPVSSKTLVGHVKTKVKDSSSESIRTIQYFLLLNSDKKAVQFFTIEGSM